MIVLSVKTVPSFATPSAIEGASTLHLRLYFFFSESSRARFSSGL